MAIDATDWTIDRATKVIQYTGDDHTGTAPTYATVLEFHRWLQGLADDAAYTGDDEMDIVDLNPSDRSTDNIITLKNGYTLGTTTLNSYEFLYDGTIIEGSGPTEKIYYGVVNFGNATVQIQLHQDGAVLSDDWWNSSFPAGQHDGGAGAAILTDSGESWTNDEFIGYTIYNTSDSSQGLITDNDGTTITATLEGGTNNNWQITDNYKIGKPVNADSTQGISHRFMVVGREHGVDIDRRKLLGTCRRFNNTYSEFKIAAFNQGNNVLALSDSDDLNNDTAGETVKGWSTITNTEGLRDIDINDDGSTEEYYSEWNRDSYTINQFYERMKYLTRDGTSSSLYGISGELFRGITHEIGFDGESGTGFTHTDTVVWGDELIYNSGVGTFQIGEAIHETTATPAWKGRIIGGTLSGGSGTLIVHLESGTLSNTDPFEGETSGATGAVNDASPPSTPTAQSGAGIILAIDDNGADGELYLQIIKGNTPVENTRIYDETTLTDYCDATTVINERTISTPFVGVSTGSALIGAYGLGMEAADAGSSDTFFDLTNTAITPPNNVTFTVDGLVAGDRVLVTAYDAGATTIDYDQMVTDTILNGAAETSVSINPTPGIPDNTPKPAALASIRIERDSGHYSRHVYTDVDEATDTFTIPSAVFNGSGVTAQASAGNNVFIGYIDRAAADTDEEFSTVYDSAQTLFIRVRDGGGSPIKNLETTGSLGTTGGSVTVNRIDDE